MLSRVVVDVGANLSPAEARLRSILDLVADEIVETHLYLFKEWWQRSAQGLPTEDFRSSQPRVIYISTQFSSSVGELRRSDDDLLICVPRHELVLSDKPAVRKATLEQQGLCATTAVLVLAAAGVDIVLPNVSFDRAAEDEIKAIKSRLAEERQQYLAAVAALADQAFDRLSAGAIEGVLAWANNEAQLKIVPRARILQSRLKMLDASLLRRAGTAFWREGVPAIGSAVAEGGLRAGVSSTAIELVRVLSEGLARSIEERRVPEASYILKLAKEVPDDWVG